MTGGCRLDGARILITGASRGIGAEMARLLGERAGSLVLVARSRDDLDALAAELKVPVQVVVADLSDPRGVEDLLDSLDGEPIDILINNAGIGHGGHFLDQEAERLRSLLELNVTSLVRLTHALLPGMIERGRGGLLNVGSIAGFQGVPYMSAYSGTKAFVNHFSEALAGELKGTGVVVTGLCPGTTRTAFFDAAGFDRKRLIGGSQDAVTVARAGLRALERGRVLPVTGLMNGILIHVQRLVPRTLVRRITRRLMRPLAERPRDE